MGTMSPAVNGKRERATFLGDIARERARDPAAIIEIA
jgi:hypothetical protein